MEKQKVLDVFGVVPLQKKTLLIISEALFIAFIIFFCFACLVNTGFWNEFDLQISLAIQDNLHCDFLDSCGKFVNNSAAFGFWLNIGFVLCIFKKTRKMGIILIICALFVDIILAGLLKEVDARFRPYQIINFDTIVNPPSGYSYPSGHTMLAFACAGAIFWFNKKIGAVALLWAAFIGFCRMYVFAHFFTDVMVGAVMGFAFSLIIYLVITEVWDTFFGMGDHDYHLRFGRNISEKDSDE